ncbi:thioesterase family protein [Acidisphaera sp. S103]|uniref:acyl-CoA thioesterase n=1 Tax=Acidisphaera sp. S103 TaxID=1747223 RepID=UPI00131A6BEA|nr:acyl-CoA thioesterase [Acidisphaera sp. S103]
MLTVETVLRAQFFELDPMNIVWHGNYARFLEMGRCDLLDRLDYNYTQMQASGFVFPIVDMRLKYVAPIRFRQDFVVVTTLVEYENRLRCDYIIRDLASRAVLTRARTTQVAVRIDTGELCLESPPVLIEKVRALV